MKILIRITNMLLMLAIYSAPAIVYAGGPGFKDDVKTWKKGGDDDDDNSHGDDDNDDDSNEIPLDGGLSFLAAAGAAYGIKRVRDSRAKK